MNTVDTILKHKGPIVHTIEPEATVYQAIERMTQLNVGALVVVAAGVVCGMITERDYLRRVALRGRTSRTTAVKEVMSPSVTSVSPRATIDHCMALMTERRIRHLPVLQDGDLVGLVSIGDVIKHKLAAQGTQIQELTGYIQGTAMGIVA